MKKLLLFFFFSALTAMQIWAGDPVSADTVWTRYTHYNYKVQFSPDGNYIATRGGDQFVGYDILIYNLQGDSVHRIPNVTGDFNYSKDGKYLILSKYLYHDLFKTIYGLELYSTETWKRLDTIVIDDSTGDYICNISPDNKILTALGSKGTFLYNYDGKLIKRIQNDKNDNSYIFNSYYTNDGKYLIYGTGDVIKFINMDTMGIEYTYPMKWGQLTMSYDSRLLAFTSIITNTAVEVLDIKTKQIILSIPGEGQYVASLAISPDNKYLAAAQEMNEKPYYRINIYDILTGKIIYFYFNYWSSIDWSPTNLYITCGAGNNLVLLNTLWTNEIKENSKTEGQIIIPNPANDTVQLEFEIPYNSDIHINITNDIGITIKSFVLSNAESGKQKVNISTDEMPNGNYFINIQSNNFQSTFKLIINK
jgi:WD40 repeat protein